MAEPMDFISAIHSVVNELIETKDTTLGVAIDLDNPTHAWTCHKKDICGNKRNKWVSSKKLITNGKPNMGKIGELSFKCYEASLQKARVTKLPSVHDMIKALCRCSDCMIDISEASASEIKKEYSFLVKVGAIQPSV